MIALLLLASVTRCAVPALCPTDAELVRAVGGSDAEGAQALADQAAESGDLVLVHAERIRRVSDTVCGEALPGDGLTITCKFTVKYSSRNAYQVAKLVKRDDGWELVKALVVTRDR